MNSLASVLQGCSTSSLMNWKKSSFPSRVRFDSATHASKSPGTVKALSFLVYDLAYTSTHPPYTLSRLMGCSPAANDNHTIGCQSIKEWLCQGTEANEDIRIDTSLGPPADLDQYFLQSKKRPDVAWYCTVRQHQPDITQQIELMSNRDCQNTIIKLGLGLIDQLKGQRNRDSSITDTSGFYFPLSEGHVEQIKVTWSDSMHHFFLGGDKLEESAVKTMYAVAEEKGKIRRIVAIPNCRFTIPLSATYMERVFGAGAYQVCSGASYVIASDDQVFKQPFRRDEREQLNRLTYSTTALICSILPDGVVLRDGHSFELCMKPFQLHEALPVVADFTSSTIAAIEELHTNGIAHLDIRAENICFRDGSALLIDFDRSAVCSYKACFLASLWGVSVMYTTGEGNNWDAEMMDWRQLGIMILNNTPESKYHSTYPVNLHHRFFEKLFNEG